MESLGHLSESGEKLANQLAAHAVGVVEERLLQAISVATCVGESVTPGAGAACEAGGNKASCTGWRGGFLWLATGAGRGQILFTSAASWVV